MGKGASAAVRGSGLRIRWTYDDDDHAWCALFPCKVGGHHEDDDGYGHGDDGESEFDVVDIDHDDQELDCESEEEEEIEFKEGNVDLASKR